MPACPGCSAPARPGTHSGVPVASQYASPGLIDAIAYAGHDLAQDPAWASSGAGSQQEYGRWCRHLCGMACLQMALGHRDGQAPPLFELLAGARACGAYTERDGQIRGLIYAPFADYAHQVHGLRAHVWPRMSTGDLAELLAQGWLVLASVHKEIRRPEHPAPARGGHLVLVTGVTRDPDSVVIAFHNPSGHTASARQAALPEAVFDSFFGCRGVAMRLG